MKFPLFSKRPSALSGKDARQEFEKWMVQGFRALSQLFAHAADELESERLRRRGYGEQQRFLERVDARQPPKP